ncbi:hypothetical protein SeMB42_g07794 [Synchytrium endobioticum]|uniref:Uncharacterized protein n=1 Tax=Synchytrium endobioticum TaxID=286115 RepID=A0A507BPA7_9FUNG|nr:hypothetical protein SeMB42_g07794 [Synchytrium endobioticum]
MMPGRTERGYEPLHCHQVVVTYLSAQFVAWRMNLIAFSRNDPTVFFVAELDTICCFRIGHEHHHPFRRLGAPPDGAADIARRIPINSILVASLGSAEVLVSVDEAAQVRVWRTSALDKTPISLTVDESAWGIATHAKRHLLAVSTNAHTITVFDMAECGRSLGTDGRTSKLLLKGHANNIPSICFSPCGKSLVSASIDQTCKIWDLKTGNIIYSRAITREWAWTCRFVSLLSFKSISSTRAPQKSVPFTPHVPFPTLSRNIRRSRRSGLNINADSSSSVENDDHAEDFGDLEETDDQRRNAVWIEASRQEAATYGVESGQPFHDEDVSTEAPEPADMNVTHFTAVEEALFENSASDEDGLDGLSDDTEARDTDANLPVLSTCCTVDAKTDAILFTSQNHLVLLSVDELAEIARHSSLISENLFGAFRLLPYMEDFNRCCFSEWVEELSCGFIASQSGMVAVVVGLRVHDKRTSQIHTRLHVERYLNPSSHPLAGMSVSRLVVKNEPHLSRFLLYMVYLDGKLAVYEFRKSSFAFDIDQVLV